MRTFILYIFLLFVLDANGQTWQWATGLNGSGLGSPETDNIVTDGTNIYAVGEFGGQLELSNDTLYSSGLDDCFIAKYDNSGNLLWSKRFGGSGTITTEHEQAYAVVDTVYQCIYLTGKMIGFGMFDNIPMNAASSNGDIFLAKMDYNGNFIWSKTFGSNGSDFAQIFLQPNHQILLAGQLAGQITINSENISSGNFLARFDSAGICTWSANPYNGVEQYEVSIAFINTDIIIAGGFLSSLDFDTISVSSNGSVDGFIAKLDSSANLKWFKSFGDSDIDVISKITHSLNGDIYCSGTYSGTVTIGSTSISNSTQDALLLKLDSAGNIKWIRTFDCTGLGTSLDIALASNGKCFIAGAWSGSIQFNSSPVASPQAHSMFIACYDTTNSFIGVQYFGQATCTGVVLDNSGVIYCSGAYYNTVNIGTYSLTAVQSPDYYLARINNIVGIEEKNNLVNSHSLVINANPNNGSFNISLPNELQRELPLQAKIISVEGKVVEEFTITNFSGEQYSFNSIPSGHYSIHIFTNNIKYVGSFIIQK